MSKSSELAKVEKKQKRRKEKEEEEAKRLKKELKKHEKFELEKEAEAEARRLKDLEEKERLRKEAKKEKKLRELKELTDREEKEEKRLLKKMKKELKRAKKEEKEHKKKEKELKKREKELKKREKELKEKEKEKEKETKELELKKKEQEMKTTSPQVQPKTSTSDRDALSQLGGLLTVELKKGKKYTSTSNSTVTAAAIVGKPKMEVKRKVIAPVIKEYVTVPVVSVPLSVPVPVTVTTQTNTTNTNNVTTITPSTSPTPTVRKPTSIRSPRERREVNPIYTDNIAIAPSAHTSSSPFIVRGLNDTEESKLLTRTFASKWYLPAVLSKIEAQSGLKYRRGRFSEEEKMLAMRLTNKFCQEQNMTLDAFKSVFFDDMSRETNNNNRLANFFVDVSQHFGGRPVVAVYDYLKRTYHPGNHRGAWTAEEDDVLLREYEKHGPKWTLIGKELNRLGINCRDRYNLRWKHSTTAVSGTWTKEEEERLRLFVGRSMEASETVSWIWVAEEGVKTRTPLQCYSHWKTIVKGASATVRSASTIATVKGASASASASVTVKGASAIVKGPSGADGTVVDTAHRKPRTVTPKWNGWKEDEDYWLIYAIVTTGLTSDALLNWKSLQIPSIPESRANPELYFRRWNYLKSKAQVGEVEGLKEQVEGVKRYLVGQSKSAAYIFSDDEEV